MVMNPKTILPLAALLLSVMMVTMACENGFKPDRNEYQFIDSRGDP